MLSLTPARLVGARLAVSLRRSMCSCLLSILALAAGAQEPRDGTQQEPPPVQVTTRLVQVNVVVKDGKGRPVADLRREDFVLTDEGAPQQISIFAMESTAAQAGEPLPPNVFSNHLDRNGRPPASITAILLDGLNTRFEDQAYAREQAIKFLEQLQPQDRVAIYTLGRHLRVLHDFTSDATPLLRTLQSYRGRNAAELELPEGNNVPNAPQNESAELGTLADAERALNEFLDQANERMTGFYLADRRRQTFRALETIANYLAGFPGRKNLIWLSSAFPLTMRFNRIPTPDTPMTGEPISDGGDMIRALQALNNAGIAMYPVDARGLVAPFPVNNQPPPRVARPRPIRPPWIGVDFNVATMQELAERTGGRAFYNTNDIRGAIRRAIDDSETNYVLGYYPADIQWDGRFRRIKVRVKRPGLHLRYRQGYYALPQRTLDAKHGLALMQSAVWSPIDATGVGLAVRATRFLAAGTDLLKIEMTIDPRSLSLENQGERRAGGIEYVLVQRREDGETLASPVYHLSIDVTTQNLERMRREGMVLTRMVEIVPGAESFLVVVRDSDTDAIGSVRIPLAVVPES